MINNENIGGAMECKDQQAPCFSQMSLDLMSVILSYLYKNKPLY